MIQLLRAVLFLALLCLSGFPLPAQQGNMVVINFSGAPTGNCSNIMFANNASNGDFYNCLNGAWSLLSHAGATPTQQPFLNTIDFTDVNAGTPIRGDIIRVEATGKWTRQALGATGTLFASDGTDVTWTATLTGAYTFTTSLTLPVSVGAAPTANGNIAYDSTANLYRGGVNGTNTQFAMTIASGTAAMTTASIASGACGTTVTVAATGVATTDAITTSRNAAVTNANGGILTLNSWPTANNVNFNYCNPNGVSNTPTATTINWRVVR